MTTFYLLFYLIAGILFGLAAGGVTAKKVNFLALGLLFWVLVEIVQTFQKL